MSGFKNLTPIRTIVFVSYSMLLVSSCNGTNQPSLKSSGRSSNKTEKISKNDQPQIWNKYNYLSKNDIAWQQPSRNKTTSHEWGALAFFSELAFYNYRGSATYGKRLADNHRFKVTSEYLAQKLKFDFHSGDQKTWVSQIAIGGEYQYLINDPFFQSFELGTAYVHAFNRHLSERSTPQGTFKRRIAGSNGSLSYLSTSVRLWNCAFLSAAVDYDWVHFTRTHSDDKTSNGFGGSVGLVQRFANDFSLNLDAEFRQPFNSYRGLLNWNHGFSSCNLDVGLFGNLTYGHDRVRTIKTIGIQLGLSFGTKPKYCGRSTELAEYERSCYQAEYCDIAQWVATPAVYVPIVLAIADEKDPCKGKAPTSTNPGKQYIGFAPIQIPPSYISSSLPVTYTISQSNLPVGGNTLSFDPATGVITASGSGADPQIITVTITATNHCGSTSQTFDILYPGIA